MSFSSGGWVAKGDTCTYIVHTYVTRWDIVRIKRRILQPSEMNEKRIKKKRKRKNDRQLPGLQAPGGRAPQSSGEVEDARSE